MNTEHKILTTDEAAAYLRVSRATIMRMIDDGRLPAAKIGRIYRIRLEDVQAVVS